MIHKKTSFTVKWLSPLVFFLFLMSCDNTRVYEQNIPLEGEVWIVGNRVQFNFTITDHKKNYNIYYLIRNSLNFPFSRLFVQYTLQHENDHPSTPQLDSEYLFDQKTGEPYGKNGIGSVFSHRFLILKNHHFKAPGNYKAQLQQFNRQDTLPGIISVGLRVEYVE